MRIILFFLVFLPFCAQAEFIPPDQIKVSTPVYKAGMEDFNPKLGKYTYSVSWAGIPAATASVSVAKRGLYYQIATRVKTFSAIDLLYKLRYQADGTLSAIDLKPVKSVFSYKENSREKHTEINFSPDGRIHSVRKQNGKEDEEYNFDPENFTLDPFSAAFIARSLSWEKGETKMFDTFNGKSRYLITFTAVDRKVIDFNNQKRDVWVISPEVTKLSDTEPSKKKLRSAEIYITADSAREIIKIKSEVFIGNVNTTLDKYESDTFGSPITVAGDAKIVK